MPAYETFLFPTIANSVKMPFNYTFEISVFYICSDNNSITSCEVIYMKCRKKRLENDFSALGRIGLLENGGYTRLAFSDEDMEARRWLKQAMEDAGLDVSIDPFGNMRGRREGMEDLPAVMIGSHIDTVPEGGNYDGVVGVLAGLEVVRALNDAGVTTRRPVEVVNFSAEESSRFGMATMGSKAMAGKIELATLKSLTDKDGISLYEALKECGYDADDIASTRIDHAGIHAFLELHVEQGPVLEDSDCSLGIVSAIAAPTRFKVCIEGRADHSGNTPMHMRKDALAGASELVLGVERITASEAGPATVGTVGYQFVTPGAMNVVPGKVELGIDLRDVVMFDKNGAVEKVIALMKDIGERRNLTITWEQLSNDEPVNLSERIIDLLRETAAEIGQATVLMPSGAGHDAMNMAPLTATGMIFIPSIGGISHNISEESRMDDICTGAELLLQTVVKLADEQE